MGTARKFRKKLNKALTDYLKVAKNLPDDERVKQEDGLAEVRRPVLDIDQYSKKSTTAVLDRNDNWASVITHSSKEK